MLRLFGLGFRQKLESSSDEDWDPPDVKKIESHPYREALHADLQQNNVYNPFSDDSRAMIRELGNVELFELCETIPKVQRSHCILIGIKELCSALADTA